MSNVFPAFSLFSRLTALLALGLVSVGMGTIMAQTNTQTFPATVTPPAHAEIDYVTAPPQPWEKEFTDFQSGTFEKDGHILPYRFYRPPNLEPGKTYPFVLLMHGAGERGNDNRQQLRNFKGVAFWEKYPCFVLAPQCPKHLPGEPNANCVWVDTPFGGPSHTMSEQPTWPMQLAMELFDKTSSEHAVDAKRIYVTGLSMGGFATWELLQREGGKFAAAIPVCGGGNLAFADKLVNIPLWVFHGGADPTVKVERSRDMVAAITKAGGHPKYTEYPGVGHDAWGPTYSNPEVWDWLFAQTKK